MLAALSLLTMQGAPDETASPFVDLYQLPEVITSNDEYGIGWTWGVTAAALHVGRWRWAADATDDGQPWVEVECRVDGRPLGYAGPRAWGFVSRSRDRTPN